MDGVAPRSDVFEVHRPLVTADLVVRREQRAIGGELGPRLRPGLAELAERFPAGPDCTLVTLAPLTAVPAGAVAVGLVAAGAVAAGGAVTGPAKADRMSTRGCSVVNLASAYMTFLV